ncbi:MAG: hypothetical protein RIS76_2431 [Verrucomicrobiota bacterium]
MGGIDFGEFAQELLDAVGGFVEDRGAGNGAEAFEAFAALAGLVRKEADEVELVGGKSAGGESGYKRAGSGNGLDPLLRNLKPNSYQ